MSAVAPDSEHLSAFVGGLEEALRSAVERLLGLEQGAVAGARVVEDLGLELALEGGAIVLSGLGPGGRALSTGLGVRVPGGHPLRARVASSLGRARGELLPDLNTAVAAAEAWWPFAGVCDTEFRKLSSSSQGPYGTLRLGYRCDQDCWFCWQDRRAPSPPLERFYGWLDEFHELGVGAVNFTGGEATTWSELPALIRRASRQYGMKTSLQTNAIRLARPAYTLTLVDAGLDAVMASLHSADPKVSDAMTRAPGTHVRTMAGLEQALAAGLMVTVTCVVEAANGDGLAAHAREIVDRLVTPFPANPVGRVTYAHPTDYQTAGLWRAQQLPLDTLRPALSAAVSLLRSAGVPVQVGGPCGFPICALDADRVGDPYQVMERSIFHPGELSHRRFAVACDACSARPRCFGLRQEYLDVFGERGLRPVGRCEDVAAQRSPPG